MEVKFIQGVTNLSEHAIRYGVETIEEKINFFLEDNPDIEIKQIIQSSASSGDRDDFGIVTMVSIWYE
ncbi:hypothetical protein [Enterococcus faecalis]|uniref:hypothetical protein n=1 Tax=Enterococcus faecalis TaxID=1351 RepID=UPI001159B254|nr:hypothetical protein [Enterococcus faecalis]UYY06294.1 hypothetical protein OLM08_10970 [Enterococcus faecalis]HBG9513110.1 hypothetical protein [Enterococcus faecalis]HBG9520584.1 hypothetical protein [Enterococcus faecalis]